MNRRECLALFGAVGSSALAGCGSDSESGGDGTATHEPLPDAIETSRRGAGDDVVEGIEIELDGPTIFTIQHDGPEAFTVELVDAAGERVATLADRVGTWIGSNALDVTIGEYAIEITADDLWQFTVVQQPVYTADHVTTQWPVTAEGPSDDVYGPIDFTESRTLSIRTWDDGDSVVAVRDAFGSIAATAFEASEAAEYTGSVSIDDDIGWIDVRTPGRFELTIDEQG